MNLSLDAITIFEDEHLLVLNKPAGIHSVSLPDHNDDTTPSFSCANAISAERPELQRIGNRAHDCGLVNRLDLMTSGVLIAAKNEDTYRLLRTAFHDHSVKKVYVCILNGVLDKSKAVSGAIGARYRRSKRVTFFPTTSSPPKRSQPVETLFVPLHHDRRRGFSVAAALTSTGARHQIRASAAALGVPLLGDHLYGCDRNLESLVKHRPCPDFFLHAFRAKLPTFPQGTIVVSAPFPSWTEEETIPFFPEAILEHPIFTV